MHNKKNNKIYINVLFFIFYSIYKKIRHIFQMQKYLKINIKLDKNQIFYNFKYNRLLNLYIIFYLIAIIIKLIIQIIIIYIFLITLNNTFQIN